MSEEPSLTLDDLLAMDRHGHSRLIDQGHPIDRARIAESRYLGVDLSLPPILHRLLWRTFRKTFHRDPATGVIRGWNVKLEQRGIELPSVPKRDGEGRPVSFGHYHLLSAEGRRFPGGYRGADYLDYRVAGNRTLDPARFGYCPLVAVNPGSVDLLLGWEVFRVGDRFLPLPDYWALVREGPLEEVVPVPVSG